MTHAWHFEHGNMASRLACDNANANVDAKPSHENVCAGWLVLLPSKWQFCIVDKEVL